jgi:hypothetical protein
MNIVLTWLAVAGAAVLLVAVAVAWIEHRRRAVSRRNDLAWQDTEVNSGARAGAVELDLSLDHPHGQRAEHLDLSDEELDQAARQAVLASALGRMARPEAEPKQPNAWIDTEPLALEASADPARTRTHSAIE